jgi:hypothetical protein
MTTDAIRGLAEDALFGRRMQNDGTCFTHNIAGVELIRGSDPALPVIEDVLRDVVVPGFSSRAFRGLTEVLGAYLVIGTRADPQRAFSFLRTLPTALHTMAVEVVATFFRYGRIAPNSVRFTPTKELLEFLEQETHSELTSVRFAAGLVLKRLNAGR